MDSWCWSCFARGRGLVNGSATFRSVCTLQIFASPRITHSEWVGMALYKFGLLVGPQFLGLNYVATIVTQNSFIVLTRSELHQVQKKNFLTQTPSLVVVKQRYTQPSFVESVTMLNFRTHLNPAYNSSSSLCHLLINT